MKAIVTVTLKPGVLDPQGETTAQALKHLGFDEVENVRIGKHIELELTGGDENRIRAMCDKLLANTVIERYQIDLADE